VWRSPSRRTLNSPPLFLCTFFLWKANRSRITMFFRFILLDPLFSPWLFSLTEKTDVSLEGPEAPTLSLQRFPIITPVPRSRLNCPVGSFSSSYRVPFSARRQIAGSEPRKVGTASFPLLVPFPLPMPAFPSSNDSHKEKIDFSAPLNLFVWLSSDLRLPR